MRVPITPDELTHLLTESRAYAFVIPLTADDAGGLHALDSDAVGADTALAVLALRRGESASQVRIGGPIVHTGARETGGSAPQDPLAGYEQCEDCGGAEFSCTDSEAHEDGGESGHGYNFPRYGARLDHQNIQALLMRSGLVNEYGAAQLAAWLDMQAYVLREPNEGY